MIDGLKPYPEYKESGVPWLGKVPSVWEVRRGKWLFQNRKELNSNRANKNVLSLTLRGVVNNDPDDPEGLVPKDYATYQLFKKDNLVFKLIDLENLRTSRVGLVHEDGIMSSAYVRLISQNTGPIRFFFHQYFDLYQRGVYNQIGGGVRSTLGASDLLNVSILFPSPDEQSAIVRFLDHANGRIERAIRAKKKLMALLNEQKQAIIRRAVTRGMNPDGPLKSSGIPWLGDIPMHWKAIAFARLSRVIRGASPRPAGDKRFFYGDFMPWLTVGEVTKDQAIFLEKTDFHLTRLGVEHSVIFPKGTLVLTNSGATLGVPKILAVDVCANDGIVALTRLSPILNPVFAYYYLSTLTVRLRDELRQGGTQPNLNVGIIRNIVCPIPPESEQTAILEFLETELKNVRITIERAEREIGLLREYRTRLVADVVTGKLDVRAAARQLPDETGEPETAIAAEEIGNGDQSEAADE